MLSLVAIVVAGNKASKMYSHLDACRAAGMFFSRRFPRPLWIPAMFSFVVSFAAMESTGKGDRGITDSTVTRQTFRMRIAMLPRRNSRQQPMQVS